MTLKHSILAATATCAMAVTPMALASGAAAHPTTTAHPHPQPSQAEAYGKYCQSQGESKKHVKGEKGTPFSQCVAAMRKVDTDTSTSPAKACTTESHRHTAGQKGTPYSECVSAGAKLLAAKHKAAATA